MIYFIDTNTISFIIKGRFPAIQGHFRKIPAQSIAIPSIVKAELEFGARHSSNYEKTIGPYNKFLEAFQIYSFNESCSYEYGKIRELLQSSGNIIGSNDMLIAATVLANKGTLVTNKVREFSRVPGLLVEDWTVQ